MGVANTSIGITGKRAAAAGPIRVGLSMGTRDISLTKVEASPEIGQGRCVGVAGNFVGLPMTLDPSSLKKLGVMGDQRAIFK